MKSINVLVVNPVMGVIETSKKQYGQLCPLGIEEVNDGLTNFSVTTHA